MKEVQHRSAREISLDFDIQTPKSKSNEISQVSRGSIPKVSFSADTLPQDLFSQ
jgi:hypothetical protein